MWRHVGPAVQKLGRAAAQFFLDQLVQVRAAMGEKAFRQKLFSICIGITVDRLAPHLSELERYKAAEAIVGLSGMLDVPLEQEQH